MADFDALFATAPKPVVDYFDRRPSVPTFRWTDIAPHEHALAFTVAKTAGFDVIEDLRAAIRQAVVDRKPFDAFQAELTPILQKKGWWGEKIVKGPGGEKERVQLGSPRRLQIMYWANVASAEAAGEWQRIQDTKDFLPNLRYLSSTSERKRPLHLSWVGTTLPADHPWWRTHFPPNGWNCKCRVEQIAAHEGEITERPTDGTRPWKNKRNGETIDIPDGIDPGWQTNPGTDRERRLSRGLADALERLPEGPRAEAVARIAASPLLDHVAGKKGDPDFRIPIAVLPPAMQEAAGASASIAQLSGFSAQHIGKDHPDITPDDIAGVPEAMGSAQYRAAHDGSVWLFFRRNGRWLRATFRATVNRDEVFLTTVHQASPRQLRASAIETEE